VKTDRSTVGGLGTKSALRHIASLDKFVVCQVGRDGKAILPATAWDAYMNYSIVASSGQPSGFSSAQGLIRGTP